MYIYVFCFTYSMARKWGEIKAEIIVSYLKITNLCLIQSLSIMIAFG